MAGNNGLIGMLKGLFRSKDEARTPALDVKKKLEDARLSVREVETTIHKVDFKRDSLRNERDTAVAKGTNAAAKGDDDIVREAGKDLRSAKLRLSQVGRTRDLLVDMKTRLQTVIHVLEMQGSDALIKGQGILQDPQMDKLIGELEIQLDSIEMDLRQREYIEERRSQAREGHAAGELAAEEELFRALASAERGGDLEKAKSIRAELTGVRAL